MEKKKSKREILQEKGMDFYTFAFPEIPFKMWADTLTEKGINPSDRLWNLIKQDMQGTL